MLEATASPGRTKDSSDRDAFDWFVDEAVIVERQPSIAVYRNAREHVVIRAEGQPYDDDTFIFLATNEAVEALIAALQRELRGRGK
ncbi:MAG: hypothetical protein ABS35_15490 [Kaistia sp. SCN 65-12]|nr:MAG: hypothetical protein ABS35_15490 [Kaistia sp. SCN 65-12]